MMMVNTYVAPSKINGLGLFAAEPIKAGTLVWKFDPRWDLIFSRREVQFMLQFRLEYVRKYAYLDAVGYILCADNAKYFNHSDDPNVTAPAGFTDDVAARDIGADEEMTVDYRLFDEEDQKKLTF